MINIEDGNQTIARGQVSLERTIREYLPPQTQQAAIELLNAIIEGAIWQGKYKAHTEFLVLLNMGIANIKKQSETVQETKSQNRFDL